MLWRCSGAAHPRAFTGTANGWWGGPGTLTMTQTPWKVILCEWPPAQMAALVLAEGIAGAGINVKLHTALLN